MRCVEWWHCRWSWVTHNHHKPPHFASCTAFYFFVTDVIVNRDFKLGTYVDHSKSEPADDRSSRKGAWWVTWRIRVLHSLKYLYGTAKGRDFKFCIRLTMSGISLPMSNCSQKWTWSWPRDWFLHFGLRKLRHSKSSEYKWYTQLDRRRFVYDTYKTMKRTRTRYGWVHMFTTHRPTLTLQLHNFDLLRTCRTSSFCTVAWQLPRFQLCHSRLLVYWCNRSDWVRAQSLWLFCICSMSCSYTVVQQVATFWLTHRLVGVEFNAPLDTV